jgi:hypothetical protein
VHERLKGPRLVAAAMLGFLLFSPPLLSLADEQTRVLGVPALYAYLFAAWAAMIVLVNLIVRRSR